MEEIDKPGEAVQSTVVSRGGGFRMGNAAKSVHPAGISERLPSGSTTSGNATPGGAWRPALQNVALEGVPLAQDFY